MPGDAPVPTALPMTSHEAYALLARTHEGKHRYNAPGARSVATTMRTTGVGQVSPYLCPFGSMTGGPHWHVGHPPSQFAVERIALAMRWLAEHRDDEDTDG